MTDTERLHVDGIPLGAFGTNAYLITTEKDQACWIVDPADGAGAVAASLREKDRTISRILITHGHGDHISGIAEVKAEFPDAILTIATAEEHMLADPMANVSGMFGMPITAPPADELVNPGDQLAFGAFVWDVLDTAGHSPGGITYYCRDAGVAIVGDALFASGIGRTDFPGADHDTLIANIREKLLTLPDNTRILPGHGPETTVAAERRGNPFLT